MRSIEIARRLASLGQKQDACRAYSLTIHENGSEAPAEELEAAAYILQAGGDYRVSYTCFRSLYNRGYFREDILPLMTKVFYEPNIKLLKSHYERNCKRLAKYPYLFRKDFLPFEELPIQFFPYDDHSGYVPFYIEQKCFGEFVNVREPVIGRNFFKDLENPILAEDVYSQYELEYLNDNVRKSEWVARENHIYLHYTDWAEFCAWLQVLNVKPLTESEKVVFLIEDEVKLYPIDFRERFKIDYSKYTIKPLAIREVTKLIWHTQLSSHNGGDLFNEVFDSHPNLIMMPSVMMSNIREAVKKVQENMEQCESLTEAMECFEEWNEPRLVEELYHNHNRTEKDILVALYLYQKQYSQFLDKNSRIVPALFFQPHFPNIVYSLRADAKNRAVLYSEVYETVRNSPLFLGFKYIKTFTPMRRPTTSHGGTVRYMDRRAAVANANRGENGKPTVISDAISERILNRSFMIDRQDRIYRDSRLVRFEDGKLNPTATFTALAAFLDIPYTESMTYCSDAGRRDPHPDTKGFDPVSVYRTYDEYVNNNERTFIEYFLRDAYRYYGYDFQYYDGKPMNEEQAKALLKGFDTMDSYIRKTWKLVFEAAKVSHDGQSVDADLEETVQRQMLDHYMGEVLSNRENTVEILMSGLRFIGKNSQPLYMMPKIELDPALLEQPLYH